MSQVFNTQDNKVQNPASIHSQLEKLRTDLLSKRQNSVEKGLVSDINMIDTALGQVEKALEEVKLDQKITNSQARLGQVRSSEQTAAVEETNDAEAGVLSDWEVSQIQAIRSVQGQTIAPGQVFASLHGREPSNISYMKDNINGLFDLVALKG